MGEYRAFSQRHPVGPGLCTDSSGLGARMAEFHGPRSVRIGWKSCYPFTRCLNWVVTTGIAFMENTLVSFPCRGERLNQLLTAHGILPTLQRTLIAEVLFVRRRHLSADQVLSQVNKGEQQVSKATV